MTLKGTITLAILAWLSSDCQLDPCKFALLIVSCFGQTENYPTTTTVDGETLRQLVGALSQQM